MTKRIKISTLVFAITLTLLLTGCRSKDTIDAGQGLYTGKELTIYNVFDNEDIFTPIIQAFKTKYGTIKVNYRKFNNVEEYRDTIINELAQGEGPDIFFMHNTWFYQDHKKLLPAPETVTVQNFLDTYVDVVASDVVIKNDQGIQKIYSFPLYVDTLGLYYNRTHFNGKIPERGKPSATWAGIEEDSFKLKKEDNSFERFQVASIALGRTDNILRGVDILLTMILQFGGDFYDEKNSKAIFADSQGVTSFGLPKTPGVDALTLFTSFALPSNRNYTWNTTLSNSESPEKEIETFVRGKVSMIAGYSYLYEEIARQTEILARKYPNVIQMNEVATSEFPQVDDPNIAGGNQVTLASYFAPVVGRNTKNPEAAWALVSFMTNQENSEYYNQKTHRPTARRDLIEKQSLDPIYGPFVKQVGIAKTITMTKPQKYEEILSNAVDQVLKTVSVKTALSLAQEQINDLIPIQGLFPQVVSELGNVTKK